MTKLRKGGNGFKYPVCYSLLWSRPVLGSQFLERFLISSQWQRWTEQQVAVILFLRWIIISQDNDTLCITVYCSPGTSCVTVSQSGSRITNHGPIRATDDPDFNLFIGPTLRIPNPRHYTDKECWQHQLANGRRPPYAKTSRLSCTFHLMMLITDVVFLTHLIFADNKWWGVWCHAGSWEGTFIVILAFILCSDFIEDWKFVCEAGWIS